MFILYCSTDMLIVVTNDDIVICKEMFFSRVVWGISRLYRMPPVFFPCRGIGVSTAVHSILLFQSHSLRYVWCVWYQPVIAYRHCFSLPFLLSSIYLSIFISACVSFSISLTHSLNVCLTFSLALLPLPLSESESLSPFVSLFVRGQIVSHGPPLLGRCSQREHRSERGDIDIEDEHTQLVVKSRKWNEMKWKETKILYLQ